MDRAPPISPAATLLSPPLVRCTGPPRRSPQTRPKVNRSRAAPRFFQRPHHRLRNPEILCDKSSARCDTKSTRPSPFEGKKVAKRPPHDNRRRTPRHASKQRQRCRPPNLRGAGSSNRPHRDIEASPPRPAHTRTHAHDDNRTRHSCRCLSCCPPSRLSHRPLSAIVVGLSRACVLSALGVCICASGESAMTARWSPFTVTTRLTNLAPPSFMTL